MRTAKGQIGVLIPQAVFHMAGKKSRRRELPCCSLLLASERTEVSRGQTSHIEFHVKGQYGPSHISKVEPEQESKFW